MKNAPSLWEFKRRMAAIFRPTPSRSPLSLPSGWSEGDCIAGIFDCGPMPLRRKQHFLGLWFDGLRVSVWILASWVYVRARSCVYASRNGLWSGLGKLPSSFFHPLILQIRCRLFTQNLCLLINYNCNYHRLINIGLWELQPRDLHSSCLSVLYVALCTQRIASLKDNFI